MRLGYFTYKHAVKMGRIHLRFLHKDPTEVPGGFLSDINPVSSHGYYS